MADRPRLRACAHHGHRKPPLAGRHCCRARQPPAAAACRGQVWAIVNRIQSHSDRFQTVFPPPSDASAPSMTGIAPRIDRHARPDATTRAVPTCHRCAAHAAGAAVAGRHGPAPARWRPLVGRPPVCLARGPVALPRCLVDQSAAAPGGQVAQCRRRPGRGRRGLAGLLSSRPGPLATPLGLPAAQRRAVHRAGQPGQVGQRCGLPLGPGALWRPAPLAEPAPGLAGPRPRQRLLPGRACQCRLRLDRTVFPGRGACTALAMAGPAVGPGTGTGTGRSIRPGPATAWRPLCLT